jgi:hypothetical protein
VLFIYITRLALNQIFSPSNKKRREVGRAKDLSAPRNTLFHKRHGTMEKVTERKMRVLFLSATTVSNISHSEKN